MVVFPAVAALLSLACLVVVGLDALRRPRPDKASWAVAFALFTTAAGAEVLGGVAGWTPLLARAYYLCGAVLVVGFLALGQLYLVAPRRTAALGPGFALLATALAAALVWDAPIDRARLASDGWHALQRGPALVALTVSLNAGGLLIVLAGTLSAAWRFWRQGVHRRRMVGCLLIATGTVVVGAGGTLTRLGRPEYLYVAMAAGVALIFAGYVQARRPDAARPAGGRGTAATEARGAATTNAGRAGRNPDQPPIPASPADPAIAFIERCLLPLPDAELGEAVWAWSVEREPVERFDRGQARRAWALRLRLSADGQTAFDAHSVPARLQLVDLYHEVLTAAASGATPAPEPRAARLTEIGERPPPARDAG